MPQPIESSPTETEKKDIQLKRKHEGVIYIKQRKPVEHHNTIAMIRKTYSEIQNAWNANYQTDQWNQ